jgi:uncharacterized membrane protein YczE
LDEDVQFLCGLGIHTLQGVGRELPWKVASMGLLETLPLKFGKEGFTLQVFLIKLTGC